MMRTTTARTLALFLATLAFVADAFTTGPTAISTSNTRLSMVDIGSVTSVEGLMNFVSNVAGGTTVSSATTPLEIWEQLPLPVKGVAGASVALPATPTLLSVLKSTQQIMKKGKSKKDDGSYGYVSYPEGKPATYELNDQVVPFEFGEAAFVRPLLKQTQLESRPLQVVYDANRHGYDAQTFHSKVDGKGAAIVLAKVGGQWCGGYNPRGWASLGQARSSVAAFLFYKPMLQDWQKVRVSRTGSMACGNDLYDAGIYFGADSFVIPLRKPDTRKVTSRLGQYFEARKDGKLTVLPRAAEDFRVQELKVLTGVYAPGEDIPNSGGVLELGYY